MRRPAPPAARPSRPRGTRARRSGHAGEIIRGRAARGAGRDGGGHRAHRHVAVHPREEGLLRGHPRRARAAWCAARWCRSSATSRRSSSSSTRPRRCGPAISTGTTTATARAAASPTRPTWSSRRPVFHRGRLVAFSQTWGHFWDIGGLRAGQHLARRHRDLPRGHHRPRHPHLPRGRAQRRGLPHLPAQLALPRHPARRHPRGAGRLPARRAARAGAVRALRRRHGAGGVGALRAAVPRHHPEDPASRAIPDGDLRRARTRWTATA